jgi:hypothetical protein
MPYSDPDVATAEVHTDADVRSVEFFTERLDGKSLIDANLSGRRIMSSSRQLPTKTKTPVPELLHAECLFGGGLVSDGIDAGEVVDEAVD